MEMPLWTPSKEQIAASPMDGLRRWCAETFQVSLPDHDALHAWSIDQPGQFWSAVWEVCGVIGERGERALIDGERMLDAQFFPDARLNFAENLLRCTGPDDALVFRARIRSAIAGAGTSCMRKCRSSSRHSAPWGWARETALPR